MGLVPVGLLVELIGGGLEAGGIIGHAAFVDWQFHAQLLVEGIQGGGILHIFLGKGGGISGIAIDQAVVVVGGVAHIFGSGGASGDCIVVLSIGVGAEAENTGHNDNGHDHHGDNGEGRLRHVLLLSAFIACIVGVVCRRSLLLSRHTSISFVLVLSYTRMRSYAHSYAGKSLFKRLLP
ncbi:hypothetical protein ELS79_07170 [Bifidobacterium longum subsp. longum]|nr:hypothetical protein ELS79_07170 [Bifidobacterium longum subsp. longum]